MLMKVKITAAAVAAAHGAHIAAAAKWSTLAAIKLGLLACLAAAYLPPCLLLYFHDSNEVVIHFSKLMMLQISPRLWCLLNQYWLKTFFFWRFLHFGKSRIQHSSSMKKPQSFFLSTTFLGHPFLHFLTSSICTYVFFLLVYKTKNLILYTLAHTFYKNVCASKSQQETCSNRNIATISGGIFSQSCTWLCVHIVTPPHISPKVDPQPPDV